MKRSAVAAAATHPLWWDDIDRERSRRPALSGDVDVDVAIVGAGFTGLWSAFYLAEADHSLRIAVLERSHVGFGASGRNGGFCFDSFAADPERIEKMAGLEVARDWAAAIRESVEHVEDVTTEAGIDCDFHKGGTIEFLVNGGQLERGREDVASSRRFGWSEDHLRLLSVAEARRIGRAANIQGGLWSAETAAIHPAKLVQGLAAAVEARGVRIYEGTAALAIDPGGVTTAQGRVSAAVVVRATEGYTAELPGHKRTLAPLYSLMIATEPLDESLWNEIGLANRETFGDLRHLVIYGQRTADGRIAFGGRGAPYDFGSRVRRNADFGPEAFEPVHAALLEVFPQLRDVAITHRWGGVLGVSRQWMPTAGLDRATGLAWAGGYVGSGVAATNLAGRTLADLITGAKSQLTTFPWVNHRVRRWEPEPLRWLGINSALMVMKQADKVERRTNRPARAADWLWRLVRI